MRNAVGKGPFYLRTDIHAETLYRHINDRSKKSERYATYNKDHCYRKYFLSLHAMKISARFY